MSERELERAEERAEAAEVYVFFRDAFVLLTARNKFFMCVIIVLECVLHISFHFSLFKLCIMEEIVTCNI